MDDYIILYKHVMEVVGYLVEFQSSVQDFTIRGKKKGFCHFIHQMLITSFISNQKFAVPIINVSWYWFHLCKFNTNQNIISP